MLIDEKEVEKRLNNPLNLLNRMREGLTSPKKDAMSLFVPNGSREKERVEVSFSREIPKEIPNLPQVVPSKVTSPLPSDSSFSSLDVNDADAKIKLALAHDSALDLLTGSISYLKKKVDKEEIKVSSIPSIISSASRVITDIRKERLERDKNKGNENIHYHFYCPTQRKIGDYEVIDVESKVEATA